MRRFLRPKDAAALMGLTVSSFYDRVLSDALFPKRVPLGSRAIGFDADEVDKYMLRKIAVRDGVPAHKIDAWIEQRVLEDRALDQRAAATRVRRPKLVAAE